MMPFSELRCPWETVAIDMQECVTLLDYMDNYDVPFAKASEEALFLRTLQLSVELLETASPSQLSAAGIDLSRICCKQFAEKRANIGVVLPLNVNAPLHGQIGMQGQIATPPKASQNAARFGGLDASAFFGSHWQAMFAERHATH